MLTRFKTNVARYPRLFAVTLVGYVLAAAESLIPRLVGIDARHVSYAAATDVILAFILSGLVYLWIFRSYGRMRIFLDILDRFEGRDVCTVAAHVEIPEEEEDGYEENPEENA